MCYIVWFRMEKYTKTRIITECVCTKEKGIGASNVLFTNKSGKHIYN